MATVKVFSSKGVQELNCFDTLTDVPFSDPFSHIVDEDPCESQDEPEEED